jgi:hypothetical protein
MSHPQLISAAVAVFVVAALLWYAHNSNSRKTEGFAGNPIAPVAGRPYGAIGELADDSDRVPADLNRAPIVLPHPVNVVPPSGQRPVATPGASTAPKEAMASRKDLNELSSKIATWLAAASQRDTEYPESLTSVQRQRRIMLQSRRTEVLEQLSTDIITDTYKRVADEISTLRREIAGWGHTARGIEAIHDFAKHAPAEELLTLEQYAEFRELFHAILNDYQGHTQPDPLQRVRTQQLQVIAQSLPAAPHPQPAIRVAAARLFLVQATRPDQPLPTLLDPAIVPSSSTPPAIANPADVISQLRDISWRLTITYDSPANAALKQQVAALLAKLQAPTRPGPAVVEAARSSVVELQNRLAGTPLAATGRASSLSYDPADLQTRATRLCAQVREAVGPRDAAALGCPPPPTATITDRFVAETTINTVCDRIRTSVPSLSPAQFNCPVTRDGRSPNPYVTNQG